MDFSSILIFVINMLQLANYDQITTLFNTLSYWKGHVYDCIANIDDINY